jgi:hypothetical protein
MLDPNRGERGGGICSPSLLDTSSAWNILQLKKNLPLSRRALASGGLRSRGTGRAHGLAEQVKERRCELCCHDAPGAFPVPRCSCASHLAFVVKRPEQCRVSCRPTLRRLPSQSTFRSEHSGGGWLVSDTESDDAFRWADPLRLEKCDSEDRALRFGVLVRASSRSPNRAASRSAPGRRSRCCNDPKRPDSLRGRRVAD